MEVASSILDSTRRITVATARLVEYLDQLDAVPPDARVVGAAGPRMLALTATRSRATARQALRSLFVCVPCGGPAYVTRYFTGTNKGRQTQVSSYPQTSDRPAAIGSARPATLMAAIGAAAVAGLAAIVNGLLVIATGPDIVIDIAAKVAGVSRSELESSLGGSVGVDAFKSAAESDYDIIKNRAMAVLICGVLLLAAGLLMRKAALWARILVTLFGLATAGFSLLIASKSDEGTTTMIVLGWLAMLVAVVAIIASWLPANARYAKSAR